MAQEAIYYVKKLIANSTLHKFLSVSRLAFIGILGTADMVYFHILFWLRVFSMVFWTINWSIQHGFNIKKFMLWWIKIITYWLLILFAKSLCVVTHLNFWIDVFVAFMIFELLFSIFKHTAEMGLPMPKWLVEFIKKQESDFEERFLNWQKKL